jgi:hypothetical protein
VPLCVVPHLSMTWDPEKGRLDFVCIVVDVANSGHTCYGAWKAEGQRVVRAQ